MPFDLSFDNFILTCQAVGTVLPRIGIHKSCIDGTLYLVDVLHAAGFVDAYPLTTEVKVDNPARVSFIRQFGEPTSEEMIRRHNATGGLTVHVGMKNSPEALDGWPGHLVAILPRILRGKAFMIDLTIIQVNDRGDFGMPPVFAEVGGAFLEGGDVLKLPIRGCEASYLAFPDDLTFREGLDTAENASRSQSIGAVLMLVEEQLRREGASGRKSAK